MCSLFAMVIEVGRFDRCLTHIVSNVRERNLDVPGLSLDSVGSGCGAFVTGRSARRRGLGVDPTAAVSVEFGPSPCRAIDDIPGVRVA